MRDGSQNGELDQPEALPAQVEPAADEEYPIDRVRQRFGQALGGRPVMVYLVLFAGAATLIVLLVIVWISATGGKGDERPICTAISPDEAQQAVLAGQVERINVLVDQEKPLESLTGIVLDMADGTCRQPAQGADVRNDLYRILGVVELYNTFGERRVRVHYQRQEVQTELLVTSTPTPLPTPPSTETPVPTETETAVPTVEPTSTPSPEPTATASHTPTLAATAAAGEPSPTLAAATVTPTP